MYEQSSIERRVNQQDNWALRSSTRSEGLPARSEGLPDRSEGLPARSEVLPARSEVLSARSEVLSAWSESLTARPDGGGDEQRDRHRGMDRKSPSSTGFRPLLRLLPKSDISKGVTNQPTEQLIDKAGYRVKCKQTERQ